MRDIGRRLYGLAAIGLGVIGLVWGDFSSVWQPVPDDFPGRTGLAYLVAAVFVLAGAALQFRRTARFAAPTVASLFAIFALLWLRRVIGFPGLFATYLGVAEQSAMAVAGLMVLATINGAAPRTMTRLRVAFGVCLLVFGAAHFIYVKQTAEMTPAWLPPSQTAWAYITGAGHAAAGLALISGVRAALAARLATLMFVSFGALVWAPQLVAHPSDHTVWGGNAINFVLIGAVWVMADALTTEGHTQGREPSG